MRKTPYRNIRKDISSMCSQSKTFSILDLAKPRRASQEQLEATIPMCHSHRKNNSCLLVSTRSMPFSVRTAIVGPHGHFVSEHKISPGYLVLHDASKSGHLCLQGDHAVPQSGILPLQHPRLDLRGEGGLLGQRPVGCLRPGYLLTSRLQVCRQLRVGRLQVPHTRHVSALIMYSFI